MGRGDQKTRQGKIRGGTYGNTRPKQSKKNQARRARLAAASRVEGGDRAGRAAVGGAGLVAGAAVLGGLAGD